MAKTIDFAATYGELARQVPELEGYLQELGLTELDADKTIPEIADAAGIAPAIIVMALETDGLSVEGYEPDDSGAGQILDDVLGHFFGNDDSDDDIKQQASAGPMFSHMEAAIHRAQREGVLPDDAGKDGQAGASDADGR